MKRVDDFLKLATQLKNDQPPAFDITNQVMAAISIREREQVDPFRLFAWFTGVSVLSALVVGIIAYSAWQGWTDPLLAVLIDLPWGA